VLGLFNRTRDELERETADNSTQRRPEGRGKIAIAVEQRRIGKARIVLDQFDVHARFGEESFSQRDLERNIRIAPTRVRHAHYGRLRRPNRPDNA